MDKCKKNPKIMQGDDFELIENLPKNGIKHQLIFDDSCEEVTNFEQFAKISNAGIHKELNEIYIEHDLIHQCKLGRDVKVTTYTHSLVHVRERWFTNEYISSTTSSRIPN